MKKNRSEELGSKNQTNRPIQKKTNGKNKPQPKSTKTHFQMEETDIDDWDEEDADIYDENEDLM